VRAHRDRVSAGSQVRHRPVPVNGPETRPAGWSGLGLPALLALQRRAGNQVVQQLVATVQRCGGQTHEGCPCAETADEAPVVARQDAGAPPPCNAPGTLRVPGSPVDSVAAAVAANCLDEAYGILNAQAMFGLLPLLDALRTRPEYAAIRSSAAGMGGPRMLVAIKAVDLHAKGGPVTGPDLRDLIDQMGGLPPDQRRDILRFIGKYAVITVRGLDIDFSYCKGAGGAGCVGAVTAEMKWAAKMQGEYAACRGKPGVKVAADVEKCVDSSLAKQGITTSVAGQTSATGVVTVTPTAMSQCQPILDRGTELHEAVHQKTTFALQKKYGAGTAAFNKAFEAADKWITDDINAYGAEVPFYKEVLSAIATLEGKI
jgi:hypothetical protein